MENILNQVNLFSARCNELCSSSMILFPTKLTELFRTVASSPDVLHLFKTCAADFSYPDAQEKYMLPTADGKAKLVLPDSPQEKIAFLFCLLSDFDNQTVDFNLFLQVFYDSDEGMDRAFKDFCEDIFPPLISAVTQELLCDEECETQKRPRDIVLTEALAILGEERKNVLYSSSLSESEKAAGNVLLGECVAAFRSELVSMAQALVLGYWYFVLNSDMGRGNAQKLLRLSEEL